MPAVSDVVSQLAGPAVPVSAPETPGAARLAPGAISPDLVGTGQSVGAGPGSVRPDIPHGSWPHPAGPGLQVTLLGDAGGGLRGAPVVLVRPGRFAGLFQQMRPYR